MNLNYPCLDSVLCSKNVNMTCDNIKSEIFRNDVLEFVNKTHQRISNFVKYMNIYYEKKTQKIDNKQNENRNYFWNILSKTLKNDKTKIICNDNNFINENQLSKEAMNIINSINNNMQKLGWKLNTSTAFQLISIIKTLQEIMTCINNNNLKNIDSLFYNLNTDLNSILFIINENNQNYARNNEKIKEETT